MGHWALVTSSKYSSRNVRHEQPIGHPLLKVLQDRRLVPCLDRSRARGDGGGATAGGWSKMSDAPLARQGERMRARLEALIMANAAPRCGARSKRTGKPCRAAAMPNGRCKVHGGKSTGPRTPEGLERSKRARWKRGHYSREAKAERSRLRAAILALSDLCDSI